MNVLPILQALVLADHVYIDQKTGKKVIAGTFNHFVADEFPTAITRPKFAFLSLTDIRGKIAVALELLDLSSDHVVLRIEGLEVEANDPLETVEMVVEIPQIPLPHAGVYAFEAKVDDAVIGSLRIAAADKVEEES